jgi:hypothetical protein
VQDFDLDNLTKVKDDAKAPVLEQYDALRVIYGDILRGYSYYKPENIYVKHFDDQDNIEIARKKEGLMRLYLEQGVPTEVERLRVVFDSGEWNEKDDEKIEQLEFNISDNVNLLKNISVPSQQEGLRLRIEEWQKELGKLRAEKFATLGVTAEHRAQKITNNYFVYFAFHKDPELKEKFWSEKQFQEMDETELVRYIKVYNESLKDFEDRNFRKIACLPFILNFASYCKDQGMFFYGKPITHFTNYQMAIYTRAMRNTFVLRESKGSPPEINSFLMVQELLNWYDEQYAIISSGGDDAAAGEVRERSSNRGVSRSVKF